MSKSEVSFANGATAQAYWITKNFFVVNAPKEKKRNSFNEWRVIQGRPWALYHAPSMLLTASLDTQKAAKRLVASLEADTAIDWTACDVSRQLHEAGKWSELRQLVGNAETEATSRVGQRRKR